MEQIFVFTAGDAAAQRNLDVSVRHQLPRGQALKHFNSDEQSQITTVVGEHGLYAWGAIPRTRNTRTWNQMHPGDWVLCVYGGRYRFRANVIATFENAAFAREFWGQDESGETWSLLYFLSEPKPIDVPLSATATHLHGAYRGFTKISAEKIAQIVADFGSLAQFIETKLSGQVTSAQSPLEAISREDVLTAIEDFDRGENAGFGPSTRYDLLYQDRTYPPKAIAGLAARRTLGRPLHPDEFSGGLESRCFRVLRRLGFELVPKGSEPTERYFVIRMNESSPYSDELGTKYHFSGHVPNYRKLMHGGQVVVDRRTNGHIQLLGFGTLAPAEPIEKNKVDGPDEYEATFVEWTPFESPRPMSEGASARLRTLPSYNVQHAIRPITLEIYDMLVPSSAHAQPSIQPKRDLVAICASISMALRQSNVMFGDRHDALITAFVCALASKPFVILTGLSGSGKTQIALRFGEWLGTDRFHVAAVRPDWTGAEALFGYEDVLREQQGGRVAWAVPDALQFMLKAASDPNRPYMLLLDEMNLAHVERYFADVLSGMESGMPCLPNLALNRDRVWRAVDGNSKIPFPSNLFVVGTVNVDETTYMFSPKVLDRANTFEFRVSTEDLSDIHAKPTAATPGPEELVLGLLAVARDPGWHTTRPNTESTALGVHLRRLHALLSQYQYEFGHRVFFESLRFAAMYEQADPHAPVVRILDCIVMQKILPRVHGSRRRLEGLLHGLGFFAYQLPQSVPSQAELQAFDVDTADPTNAALNLSFDKIKRMLTALRTNQFTSFTE